MIYLDNNASTACDPEVIDTIQKSLSNPTIANPSSNHAFGWAAHDIYKTSKDIIANIFNALPDDIIFTSGASEANNQAIIGTIQSAISTSNSRKQILVSAIEHKCVLNATKFACDLFNFEMISIPVTQDGIIDMISFKQLLSNNVLLVSVMAVNNEIGTVQPIAEIGALCREFGCIFHVDGAQAGYEEIDIIQSNIDMLSLSAHKIYGPVGVGVLIVDSMLALKPQPIIHGGLQQSHFRSGTIAPYLCEAMSLAVTKMHDIRNEEKNKLLQLRILLLDLLDNEDIKYVINGSMTHRHPGNLNISIPGYSNEIITHNLQPDFAISTGSACNSGTIQGSYVLQALGLENERINSAIRICIGRFNTKSDIILFVKKLKNVLDKLSL